MSLSLISFGSYLSNGKFGPPCGVKASARPLTLTGGVALAASACAYKSSSTSVVTGAAVVAVIASACFLNVLCLARDTVLRFEEAVECEHEQNEQMKDRHYAVPREERQYDAPIEERHREERQYDAPREAGTYEASRDRPHEATREAGTYEASRDRPHEATREDRSDEASMDHRPFFASEAGPNQGSQKREGEGNAVILEIRQNDSRKHVNVKSAEAEQYFKRRLVGQMLGTGATMLVVGAAMFAVSRLVLNVMQGRQIPVPVVLHSAVASVVKPLMTPKV